jgi:threonine dehydrogenase-like Zn-dependent dehydrogenase
MSTDTTGTLAYMTRPGELAFAKYEVPSPGPQAVVMNVLRSNVCGSELHIWNGKHPVKKRGGLGHEMVGTVAALGEGRLTDNAGLPLSVGDRVVATYFQTCESCPQCRGGQRNLCDNAYEFFGRQPEEAPHFHAAFGTHYYVHPRQHLYKVPESLSDAVAAGANCALSQVMFGLDQIDLRFGETLLVQGAGGLGLSAVAVAKARGCRVIVLDGVASRLEQALDFGADHVLNIAEIISLEERIDAVMALTQGRGPDVALEVTGVPAAFSEGLQQLRRGGRYLVMGNLSPGATVPFDPGFVTRKALTIKHVDRYDGPYLARALEFLERHAEEFPFGSLVDAEYELGAVEQALNDSAQRKVTRAAIRIAPQR